MIATAQAGFEIRIDPPRQMVHIRMRGFWDHDMTDAFAAELDCQLARILAHGARKGELLGLVDLRALDTLDQDIARRFRALAAGPGAYGARVCLLVDTMLMKLQMRHVVAGHAQFRLFRGEEAALGRHWLITGEEPPGETAAAGAGRAA